MDTIISVVNLTSRHEEDAVDTDDMLLAAKGTAMGVLFIASTLTGTLPFVLARVFSWNMTTPTPTTKKTISLLLALGGGILLATTFLHLLPEVRHTMDDLQASGVMTETDFSLAELLMCVGFFVIYLISEVVHCYITRKQSKPQIHTPECPVPHCESQTKGNLTESNSSMQHNGHSHVPLADLNDETILVALRGLLIVLALSIHELFEGLALGLERSTSTVWLFFGAIAAHKLVLAFCVGIELLVAKTKLWVAVGYILLFAAVSPIGIGIGMAVSNFNTSSVAGVILQALATGTLVYVVFFEILKKSGAGFLQFLAVIIGFFVMFGLQQVVGHHHSHGEDDSGHGHSHSFRSHEENGHVDHSHMDDLRQKLNILKQAGNLLAQSAERVNKDEPK